MTPILHYYGFADGVTAFTTTRHGGYSKGNYSELNINPHRGDDPEAVERNLNAVAKELGLSASHIVRQHQVHETDFRFITDGFFRLPENYRDNMMEGVDGVATDESCVCIGVFTADCIPVLFYDPKHCAIAAAHAGWRGTVQRIAAKMLSYMRENFGTCAKDVRALIGPGITLKNFEVGQDVYDKFAAAGFDMNSIARKFPAMRHESGDTENWSPVVNNNNGHDALKWHIDLPECNRLQLLEAGVLAENIILTGIDTYDNHDDYFSARRLKEGFGTMYTGLFIR